MSGEEKPQRVKGRSGKTRRAWRWIARLAAWGVLLVVLLPLWFPWVFRLGASMGGVRYSEYESIGFRRFALREVQAGGGHWRLEISRIEAPLPTAWIWHRYFGGPGTGRREPRVEISGWRVTALDELEESPGPGAEGSTASVLDRVGNALRRWGPWLRTGRLDRGAVRFGRGEIEFPALDWGEGVLSGQVEYPARGERLDVRVNAGEAGRLDFRVGVEARGLVVEGGVNRTAAGWVGEGSLIWRGDEAKWQAEFGAADWLPREATISAGRIRLPADWIVLEDYEALEGSLEGRWSGGRFDVRIEGAALPVDPEDWLRPAARGSVGLHGDGQEVFLDDLVVEAPWGRARLSAPVGIDYSGKVLTDSAALVMELDLERLPEANATGKLSGNLELRRGTNAAPEWRFDLQGVGVGWRAYEVPEVRVQGVLIGRVVTLNEFEAILPADSTVSAQGEFDLASREIKRLDWRHSGGFLSRFLPEGVEVGMVTGEGFVEGPVTNLHHRGQLTLENLNRTGMTGYQGQIRWEAHQDNVDEFQLSLDSGEASLELTGSADGLAEASSQILVELREFEWRRTNGWRMGLERPVLLEWSSGAGGAGATSSWRGRVVGFRLAGDPGRIEVDGEMNWPVAGRWEARLEGLASEWLKDWWGQPLPEVQVGGLEIRGEWDRGPIKLWARGQGRWRREDLGELGCRVEIGAGPGGVEAIEVVIRDGLEGRFEARGRLPFGVEVTERGLDWGWLPSSDLALEGRLSGTGPVGEKLLDKLGVQLEAPSIEWALSGTRREPDLRVYGWVGRVEFASTNLGWVPSIETVAFRGGWSEGRLHVDEGHALVAGQSVEVSLDLPMAPGTGESGAPGWSLPALEKVSGRVRVRDAELAVFGEHLPAWLLPQGRASADIEVLPELELVGTVRLWGAATRPTGPLASVRDIRARLRLDGHWVVVEEIEGKVGGRAVQIAGSGEWERTGLTRFEVRLQGTNVPLVRQSGVVVRSDLDLRVVRTNASLPVVQGDVLIHDSLVVQDLGMLIPGETRPGRRPPYFRVGPGPLAAWQLDVGVRSDRGMRLLSPVLSGDLSSNVRLTGTLGDPMATGELRLNSGKLIFPFANLEVAYGSVALSPRSPDDPEVLLSASGRVLGYQVEVDVSGTALRPLVMLSSVPPLTTQEILLLLASGQFPRGQREFSATDKLGRLGLFLGRDLLTRLGFTGASAERVIIRSGSSISAEGRPTYELEYRLTDDFSAVGEYDRFGGINGGFKWRLYSR